MGHCVFDSDTECIHDAVERGDSWFCLPFLHVRDIRAVGADATSQLSLRHLSFLTCIFNYLTGIESVCLLLGFDTFRSAGFAELDRKSVV